MFSSNTTTSPPPKRRRIDGLANQVDEDIVMIVAENDANGESDVESELEFEDESDLRVVEDIEPEITPGQATMVLGLQSGKSWTEVESKLRATCYSGTSIKASKKREEEKKEHKKHTRKFNKMTKYFPKSSSSSAPAPTPAPAPAPPAAPAGAPAPAPASILEQTEVPSDYVLAPELDTSECDYEASDSDHSSYEADDSSYEEAVPSKPSKPRAYGKYQREKERQEAKEEKLDLYRSHVKALQTMLEKKVLPTDHKVEKTGRKQKWESTLQFRRATSLVIFYNLMIHGSKSRIEASGLAALSQGKAQSYGGRSIRKWARIFEETGELPSSKKRCT